MKAVILAAGDGGRLGRDIPKILLELHGKSLLEYHVDGLQQLKIEEIILITGFRKELIDEHMKKKNLSEKIKIKFVVNDKHDIYENGYSVLCAKGHVKEPFLMFMGDHLIHYPILKPLLQKDHSTLKGILEVVDSDAKYMQADRATRVLIHNLVIEDSGKKIENFNALDTGFFILTPHVFDILERNKEQGKTEWNDCVVHFLQQGIPTFDIKSNFWLGINTEEEFAHAERILHTLASGTKHHYL
ncbi:NTP transferase domain-containing protein [Candidatus Woesearchaeota archaeon]|nr:NTP transferase domain-containing protein [Candidatus Woesearchaeota archaeon]